MKLSRLIRSVVKRMPFAKHLYKKFHIEDRIRFYKERKQMEVFAKHGDSVIAKIHEVLTMSGHTFFVDAGTLIGIYRDGKLLKRDMDVDMGVKINSQEDILKIRELFKSNGFKLNIIFETPSNGVIQDAFDYNGIRVDMSYFVTNQNNDICYILYDDNKIAKMTFSKIENTSSFKYKNQTVNIPIDSDLYLEERYGKTWRKPDPYFKYWEAPCVTTIEGRGICTFV